MISPSRRCTSDGSDTMRWPPTLAPDTQHIGFSASSAWRMVAYGTRRAALSAPTRSGVGVQRYQLRGVTQNVGERSVTGCTFRAK